MILILIIQEDGTMERNGGRRYLETRVAHWFHLPSSTPTDDMPSISLYRTSDWDSPHGGECQIFPLGALYVVGHVIHYIWAYMMF